MPPRKLCRCGSGKRATACCQTRLGVALGFLRNGVRVPEELRASLTRRDILKLQRAERKAPR